MARRPSVRVIDGRPCVVDDARPAADIVDVRVGGTTVGVAAHLCGWLPGAAPDAPWPDEPSARAALAGFVGDDDLLAGAAALAGAEPAALPAAEETALLALRHRHPGAFVDGPHRDEEGWHVTVSGSSALGWLVGRGDTPRDAARDALEQAARRARGDAGPAAG